MPPKIIFKNPVLIESILSHPLVAGIVAAYLLGLCLVIVVAFCPSYNDDWDKGL